MGDESPPGAGGTPPGWYPDTAGGHRLRYWDGSAWTDQYVDQPDESTAPAAAPSVPATGADRTRLIALLAGFAALVIGVAAAIVINDDSSKTDKERAATRELESTRGQLEGQRKDLEAEAARVAALAAVSKQGWDSSAFEVSFLAAKVGDCVNDVADNFRASRVVPCTEPHNGEVFAVVDNLSPLDDPSNQCAANDTVNAGTRVSFSLFSGPQKRVAVCVRE